MKVFLSCSGDTSRAVAEALKDWLKDVLQATDPWIWTSSPKGAQWPTQLAGVLAECRVGISCLTPDNLTAPWLLFEAGALSNIKDAHVCTFLLGVEPPQVQPPLGHFQHTVAQKDDVRKLLQTINELLADRGVSEKILDRAFIRCWPDLETQLKEILAKAAGGPTPKKREDREILEEILETVRGLRLSRFDRSRVVNLLPSARLQRLRDAIFLASEAGANSEDLAGLNAAYTAYANYTAASGQDDDKPQPLVTQRTQDTMIGRKPDEE